MLGGLGTPLTPQCGRRCALWPEEGLPGPQRLCRGEVSGQDACGDARGLGLQCLRGVGR